MSNSGKYQNKSICFFNTNKAWGGGEKWHIENACEARKYGARVWVCCRKNSPVIQECLKNDLPCFSFSLGNLSFLNPLKYLKLYFFFRKHRPDVVILNLPADLKVAGVAARWAGIKRIIYRRGSAIPVKNTVYNRFLFKHIITEVLANSYATKNTILANNARMIPDEKIKVIYNGLKIDEYDRCPTKKVIDRNITLPAVGAAGRLVEQKGFDSLIKIIAEMNTPHPVCELFIAGDGKLREELQDQINQLNAQSYIHLVGFMPDMKSFMYSIDLFVLSSHWEGFGYVLAEAMAAQKAIVAYDVSSNPELVRHEYNGFLAEYLSEEKLAHYLEVLIENKDLRTRLGQNGRAMLEKQFDFYTNFNEFAEFALGKGAHHS